MPDTVDEAGGRSGNRPVLTPDHAVLSDRGHLAESEVPVTTTRGGGGVAHKTPAVRCRADYDSQQIVGYVNPVGDELDAHTRVGESSARQSWRAGGYRSHRVEDVSDSPPACVEAATRLVRVGIAVTKRHNDVALSAQGDEWEGIRQFGSQSHHGDNAGAEQRLEEIQVRWDEPLDRVRPSAERRQERPLEVHAEHASAIGLPAAQFGDPPCRRACAGNFAADEGWLVGEDTVPGERLAQARELIDRRDESVDAQVTVYLQVYEAGNCYAALASRKPDRGNGSAVDGDVAGNEASVLEKGGYAEAAQVRRAAPGTTFVGAPSGVGCLKGRTQPTAAGIEELGRLIGTQGRGGDNARDLGSPPARFECCRLPAPATFRPPRTRSGSPCPSACRWSAGRQP